MLTLILHLICSTFDPGTPSRLRTSLFVTDSKSFNAHRPRAQLGNRDRFFWVLLSRLWKDWRKPLTIVQPETVIRSQSAVASVYRTVQ